jgi:hypothetical protein
MAAKRRIFIDWFPSSNARPRGLDYINPGGPGYFCVTAEGRDQPFQRRRKPAIGGDDGVSRRQLRRAVTGGGMAGAICKQLRRLDAAALDYIGAARMKAAACRRIERARHLALQQDAAALGPRFWDWDRGQ